MTDVETIKQKRAATSNLRHKEGGDGFDCDERGSFDKECRDLAWSGLSISPPST